MAKKQGKLGNIIFCLLLVVVLVGIICFLAYYNGGFTGGLKIFSIECNGKEITTSASGFEMTKNEPLIVNIKYRFVGENASGYSLKVIPNKLVGKNFDFKVDEHLYSYQAEKDLTNGFDIEYGENSFSIKPKGNITDILQANYPNKVVEECSRYSYENMFTLVVYSYDGESSVLLNFSVPEKVFGIELDKGVIVF